MCVPVHCQATISTDADLSSIRPSGKKIQQNSDHNTQIFSQENENENVICKWAVILYWPQCVELVGWVGLFSSHFLYMGFVIELGTIAGRWYNFAGIISESSSYWAQGPNSI